MRPLPDTPWLSVLMPVHDGEAWLGETLASIACQDARGIEVIILDSSPEPRCGAIVRDRGRGLTVRYEHCPDMPSWTAKTNLAARWSRSSHLTMLHQDDLWLPGRAEALRAALTQNSQAVMWLSPVYIIDRAGRKLGQWRCPLRPGVVGGDLLRERLLVQNFVAVPAAVFRKDAWMAVGGLDETLWYTPDWDLYLKLAGAGPVVYHPIPSAAFRIHAGSLTVAGSRDRSDFASQMATVIDRHIGSVPAKRRRAVQSTARASAMVNQSLAVAAATGATMELARACAALLRLTPFQAFRYWRDSRIAERLWPRLRARLAGAF